MSRKPNKSERRADKPGVHHELTRGHRGSQHTGSSEQPLQSPTQCPACASGAPPNRCDPEPMEEDNPGWTGKLKSYLWGAPTLDTAQAAQAAVKDVFSKCYKFQLQEKLYMLHYIHRELAAFTQQAYAEFEQQDHKLEASLKAEQHKVQQLTAQLQKVEMGINRKIQMNQMSGVILKPGEQDELQTAVNAYFNDTLTSVANRCAKSSGITQDQIVQMFMKAHCLGAQFLAHQVISVCADIQLGNLAEEEMEAFRSIVKRKDGQRVLEQFLTGDIYANTEDSILSIADWEICKAAILVKSYFLKTDGEKHLEAKIREIVYGDAFEELVADSTTKFLDRTVSVLKRIFLSEMPIIPWTGLTTFDEKYAEVHLSQSASSMTESAMQGCPILSFKRPVLLFCANRNVKVKKGKVTLKTNC